MSAGARESAWWFVNVIPARPETWARPLDARHDGLSYNEVIDDCM